METAAKKKLLVYSDCYVYGGSERLLPPLILNPAILAEYEIHFAYRRYPAYEAGLADDYGSKRKNFHPLFALSNETLFYNISTSSWPSLAKSAAKIPFWCLQKSGFYLLCNFLVMRAFVKKIGPDIVHVNNGGYPAAKSCFAFVLAAKSAGVKNIVYQVNNIASVPKTKLSVWIDQEIINKDVNYFITASLKAREALAKNRNFSLDKIVNVPSAVFNKAATVSKEQILKEFSWPVDSFLLCEVAFLSERKGQVFLLKAIKDIELKNPDLFKKLRLIFVGDGEEEGILKKFVHDNDLGAHVAFAGYRADRLNFINACDVFVLPSIANEDMPIVILEAMSMGKAIIASDFAGIKEELENGVSGILVEPDAKTLPTDLARAILDIYGNGIVTYGPNAKKRFDEYFSVERYGRRLIEVYNSMNE